MPEPDRFERFEATDRETWRRWLEANHNRVPGVWLVTYKRTSGKGHLDYGESVEEALCFGWIDSRQKTLDDERSMLLYTPRKPGGRWSAVNKVRIEQLVAEGRMTAAGLEKIEAAKLDGSWTIYDAVEAAEVPVDLGVALGAVEGAAAGFEAFNLSTKKQLLWWIVSAKRPATRAERIERVVRGAIKRRSPLASERSENR